MCVSASQGSGVGMGWDGMGQGLQPRQEWTVPAQYTWPGTHTLRIAVTLPATKTPWHRDRMGRGQLREQARQAGQWEEATMQQQTRGDTPTHWLAGGSGVPGAAGASWCPISSRESLQERGASCQHLAHPDTAGTPQCPRQFWSWHWEPRTAPWWSQISECLSPVWRVGV